MRRAVRAALSKLVLAGLVVVSPSGSLSAQSAPTPDADPTLPSAVARPLSTRVSSSAVAAGLADAGLLLTDADVLFYNPGMLTAARGVAGSMQRFGEGATTGSFASVQALGGTSIALGVRVVDYSTEAVRYSSEFGAGLSAFGDAGPVRGESVALTAGAARAIGPVRVGVAATYARDAFGLGFDESVLMDLGAVMPFGPGNALGVTLVVQQLGGGLDLVEADASAPWRSTLGVGGRNYPLATFWDVSGVAQLSVDADGTLTSASGAELAYVPVEGVSIAFRVGSRLNRRESEGRITGGLGFSLDRYSLDYAVDPLENGVTAHRIGVRIR